MKRLRLPLVIITVALLTSCATRPSGQMPWNQNLSWEQRQKGLQKVTDFNVTGAIGIRTPKQSETANLTWSQTGPEFYVLLYGPLGAGRVTLEGHPQQVVLTAQGKVYHAHSPEALMQQLFGWQLPVSHLVYWVRGLPAPNTPAQMTFDEYHHIVTLAQEGWVIEYQRYTAVNNVDLPSKLQLTHNTLQVKMVMSTWRVNS